MPVEEAIVLVGGFGTRLRTVVSDLPKPLAPVGGRPFLAWVLDHLVENGIKHVVLAAGYMADKVVETVGKEWRGMTLDYSLEVSPLGTGGAIRQASGMLCGAGVHVLNGDTFLKYDLAGLEVVAGSKGCDLVMALAHVDDVARYGAVACAGGRVTGFLEKGSVGPGRINAGSYFLTRRAILDLPNEDSYSFETGVLRPFVEAGRVCAFEETGGFIDIGVPEDYRRAQQIFVQS